MPHDWILRGATAPDLVRNETLPDIFAQTVRRSPDRPALGTLGSNDTLTYTELDARATRVAQALVARGVKRGDLVGLWFRRSIDLHIAMLGVLKAGAGYLPFDAEAPRARIESCLADCGARHLVTHAALGQSLASKSTQDIDLADLLRDDGPVRPLPAAQPDDPAYAIYTSGSTGEPKGILVSHRNVCHFLRAVNADLRIEGRDVVLQQASIAFDLSVEEIFVPYLVGATIRVATEATLRDIDALAATLERDQVTVLDTVPTLLSMLEQPPKSLRLVVTGGEACPDALVARWTSGGCRLVNTYGPTETTVVATAQELTAGEPVTIGRPIANHTAYIVDETLQPVPRGQVGELLIGGPGVTAGYIRRPELTAQKFVSNPHAPSASDEPIVYRTGDAVSIDEEGRLAFHGRIDTQVKVRGFRIELGEIEALIAREAGVRMASVSASLHGSAGEVLVAHVVADASFDASQARRALAAKLPPYMVPTLWRRHDELPLLASGKIDRKALAALPVADALGTPVEQEAPSSLTEAHLLKAAREILGLSAIDLDADFFNDLGGHSLLAARFVSEVRKVPHLAGIALQDVYTSRSIRALARALDVRLKETASERADLSFPPPPLRRRFLCGLAQAIALPFIITIVTAQWIGLLLSSIYLVREDAPLWIEVAILCTIYIGLNLGAKTIVVAFKWLVIGRTKPGIYPLWGAYYFRIWLVQRLVHLTTHKFLQGSPLMPLYLRALGAEVGRDAIIGEFEEGMIDLVSIGDRSSIGSKVRFANVEVIGDQVHVGRIDIGAGAYIGNACVLGHDTVLGAGAELGDMTSLAAGTSVGAGERWDGAPARCVGLADPDDATHPSIGRIRRAWRTMSYFVAYNFVLMIGLLPIFPAFYLLSHLDAVTFGERDNTVPWTWVFLFAWPAALGLVFVSMLIVITMRWVLMPQRVRPGRHSIYSSFYFRKWMMGLATESMLETLNSLYATVFMRNWYRLMGSKVGAGTEISANFAGRWDLITLGANNFIGDEVIFGDEEIRNGWMSLERVETGDRVFFGNLAVVGMGARIENDALIGVKSRLPESLHVKQGETWFGSPAIAIPNRQRIELSSNWTYKPPTRMRLWRTLFEGLHTSFPTAVLISLAYVTSDVIEFPINSGYWGRALAMFLVAGVVLSMIMLLVSVAAKWIAMGVYRPLQKPMWSWWAMRTEAVSVLYGGLSSKVMLDYVRGTPFMPWLLRLYGMQVGRGVWLNCADVTEFDCISIGDYSVVNMLASPQTHLYEDRVMKVGRIEIGRGVTLGTAAIVLYDTKIGDYARLEPLTVVMKGEHIPAHTVWSGAPSQRIAARPSTAPAVRTGSASHASSTKHEVSVA
jgi:non-ribosomal peptide synthetase-like protein